MEEKQANGVMETASIASSGDENKERGNWGGKLDFLLSCIGYAVGLGNVWRFPYLAFRSGGGSFLIPYVIMLAFAGLPLFFLELAFGQFASQGPITIWKISPFFKGVGYAMVLISALVSLYYNVVIAWTLFYLFASFTSELPWETCNHEWNTAACTERIKGANVTNTTVYCNVTQNIVNNCTWTNATTLTPKSPSEEYWENYVLQMSSGIEESGTVRWQLALCLLLAWIIVFLCLIKGIKSSGKVVYFTATFPYIVLVILLVRGVTLDGAIDGIKFYVTPQWDRLADAKVWGDAAVQIFYSLGVAFGALHAMASYNKFHNNCYRDALIVAIINCATSVFAGFVIFSVIGFMAYNSGLEPGKVVKAGPGLAFIAYPEGIAKMPIAPLWSILFFLMLLTLGLDSQFAMMDVVISGLADEFPVLRRKHIIFTAVLCIVFYLLGLTCVLNSGIYWFNLIEWYCAGHSLLIVGILEIVAVMYVYGFNRFAGDIEIMLGFRPNIYWKVCWCGLTPLLSLGILVFMSVQYTPVYLGDYQYPQWAEILGWLIALVSIVQIPIWMVIKYCQKNGLVESMKKATAPEPDWGPAVEAYRTGIYASDYQKDGVLNGGYQQETTKI